MTVINNIGILWIYSIGTEVQIWLSSLLSAIPLVVFLFLYPLLPESPYYLIMKGKTEEGKGILQKLRNEKNVDEEFGRIKDSITEINFKKCFKDICTVTRHRRAIFISIGCFLTGQLTGGITFVFYAHLIFKRAGDVSANTLSIIKAILQLISCVCSAYAVETTGKRPLLIISCVGSSLFMAAEGIYFYLHDNGYDVSSIWWLPLVAMILFNMCQVIGLQSIPLVLLGELFDPSVKPVAVCISKMSLSVGVLIVGKLFQILVDGFGNATPFFVFCVMGVLGLIFVVFCVPETRGKSLEDIQYYLEYNTYEKNAKSEEMIQNKI